MGNLNPHLLLLNSPHRVTRRRKEAPRAFFVRAMAAVLIVAMAAPPAIAGTVTGVSAEVRTVPAGQALKFSVAGEDEGVCGIRLEYGTGDVDTARMNAGKENFPRAFSYTYAKPGTYTVTAKGTREGSAFGCPGQATLSITVIPAVATVPMAKPAPPPATRPRMDSYITDARGCKLFNPFPRAGESVEWSGACKDGYADGPGRAEFRLNGVLGGAIEGTRILGRLHGPVTATSSNAVIESVYVNGLRHGSATFSYTDGPIKGARFEMTFVDGMATGKAVQTYANGARYEGDFVDNRRTGQGVFTWPDGGRYEGEFKENARTGKGIYTTSKGSRFRGEFIDGKLYGMAVVEMFDGGRYEGQMADGRFDGKGIYTWKNGDRYAGDFSKGLRSGQGEMLFAERGGRYEGGFLEGKLHGKGIFITPDGKRREAYFENGKEVKQVVSQPPAPAPVPVQSPALTARRQQDDDWLRQLNPEFAPPAPASTASTGDFGDAALTFLAILAGAYVVAQGARGNFGSSSQQSQSVYNPPSPAYQPAQNYQSSAISPQASSNASSGGGYNSSGGSNSGTAGSSRPSSSGSVGRTTTTASSTTQGNYSDPVPHCLTTRWVDGNLKYTNTCNTEIKVWAVYGDGSGRGMQYVKSGSTIGTGNYQSEVVKHGDVITAVCKEGFSVYASDGSTWRGGRYVCR